jgi:hypothetical protein
MGGVCTDKVLGRRIRALLMKEAILLSDQFQSHLKDSIKQKFMDGNLKLAVIPGGMPSQLQMLDIFEVFMTGME